jgi:hypothetical protein
MKWLITCKYLRFVKFHVVIVYSYFRYWLFSGTKPQVTDNVRNRTDAVHISVRRDTGRVKRRLIYHADGAVLIADNEDSLQRLLYQFMSSCQKYNIKVWSNKTKTATVYKEPLKCKLEVQGKMMEQIITLKYLGVEITSNGPLQSEVKHQS